ncbi:MAG: hypothetical protein LBH46_02465 [Rickettsiales bacterium]|jgi:hypothetical protein|nr:hypothetical protein [Rickettsiales bacterium]
MVHQKQLISELETLAAEVLQLKIERVQRRPLLIEFCGSPKSGKSTTINSLNIFLKRNGFKTMVLTERASVCPIKNKKHPFFNIWTLSSALTEIVKNIDLGKDKVDIIISDRGLFDSLCWFEWLNNNPSTNAPHLDKQSYDILTRFVLMDMWTNYLDLIYVFQVSPKISIKREYANLLTEKRGSIMTEEVLEGFNNAINSVVSKYGVNYRDLQQIQTDTKDTDNNPNQVSYNVTLNILKVLKNLLVEKIGYIKLKDFNKDEFDISSILKKEIYFDNRDTIEKSNNIQIIPIAVITNKERTKVLVVKKSSKRTSKDSPEHEKLLLYIGGHIRVEDRERNNDNLSIIKKALRREIQEEIGESIAVENPNFTIYYCDNDKSKKHLAICFIIEMNLDDKKFKLTSDEFIMKTGTTKSGQVYGVNQLLSDGEKFEAWSSHILRKVFNKKVPKQSNLFTNNEE